MADDRDGGNERSHWSLYYRVLLSKSNPAVLIGFACEC